MIEPENPIELQTEEFAACLALSKAFETLMRVAVVDDDYPEYRHRYDGAVNRFLKACRLNRRPMP